MLKKTKHVTIVYTPSIRARWIYVGMYIFDAFSGDKLNSFSIIVTKLRIKCESIYQSKIRK